MVDEIVVDPDDVSEGLNVALALTEIDGDVEVVDDADSVGVGGGDGVAEMLLEVDTHPDTDGDGVVDRLAVDDKLRESVAVAESGADAETLTDTVKLTVVVVEPVPDTDGECVAFIVLESVGLAEGDEEMLADFVATFVVGMADRVGETHGDADADPDADEGGVDEAEIQLVVDKVPDTETVEDTE